MCVCVCMQRNIYQPFIIPMRNNNTNTHTHTHMRPRTAVNVVVVVAVVVVVRPATHTRTDVHASITDMRCTFITYLLNTQILILTHKPYSRTIRNAFITSALAIQKTFTHIETRCDIIAQRFQEWFHSTLVVARARALPNAYTHC